MYRRLDGRAAKPKSPWGIEEVARNELALSRRPADAASAFMRRFIVIGQAASAAGQFSLDDLPGSSGRLDVLLRCVRASLLISHGIRRDVIVYLVLQGGLKAPRVLRIDGSTIRFVRPDERSLATMVKKVLVQSGATDSAEFVQRRPGLAVADGGLEIVIADLNGAASYLLDENAPDLRGALPSSENVAFFIGDHLGIGADAREKLDAIGAIPISVGPVSLHSDDVVAIVTNELDRCRTRSP